MPKMCRRLSSITTERRGTPSSPSVAENGMNFQQNYTTQREVPKDLGGRRYGTTNASGGADTRGVGTAFDSGRMESPNIKGGATKI